MAARARSAGAIAIDTEFVGEGRYRTLLCLIQVAVPADAEANGGGESWIELIDPLHGGDGDPLSVAAPLADVLADPDVQVVMHAGRQDVALLRRTLSTEIANVFDTQLAAGFIGLPAQRSYEALLSEILGVRLAKSASFTRWDSRPLTAEQLSYAREDVLHLLELAAEIQRRLDGLGRLQWALQECETVAAASDERDLESVFARLPRIGSAGAAAQTIARELVRWREQTARRQDRPVQSVLADAALVEIARRPPRHARALAEIRGLPRSAIRRSGDEIVEVVAASRKLPAEAIRTGSRARPPDPADAPLVALAEALTRARTREAGLAYELVAAKAELQAIVAARRSGEPEPDVRALKGWRRELVGEEILRLIDGEISLAVRDGALQVQP